MPFHALRDLTGRPRSAGTADWLQLAAYLVLVVIVVAGFWRTRQVSDEICQATRANRTYIRGAIKRARQFLPTTAYYRTHPAELRHQRAELDREISSLPARPCP